MCPFGSFCLVPSHWAPGAYPCAYLRTTRRQYVDQGTYRLILLTTK